MEVQKIPKRTVSVIEPQTSILVDKEKYHQKRVAAYLRAACAAQQADPRRAAEDQAVPSDCGFSSGHTAGCHCTGKIPT